MIRFLPAQQPHLRLLAARLREWGFAQAVRALCGDLPVYHYRHAMRDLKDAARPAALDDRAWAVLSLFFLGRPLPLSVARDLLGLDPDPLIAIGLLSRERLELRCDRCGMIPVSDGLFLVSRLLHSRSEPGSNAAYFGQDTMELLREAIAVPAASLLEVGCGPGIVGLLAQRANRARRVVGVELCDEAVAIALTNAALNEVAYDVRQGDLYAPASGERFDLILADPPCIAVPDDLAFPLYGMGGRHGDRLLRRIVNESAAHLTPEGRLFAVTELHCAPGDMPFLRWLQRWCGRRPGRQALVEIVASRHLPPDYHQSLGDSLAVLPGSAGTEKVGARFATYAAARRLYFGYSIRMSLTQRPAEPGAFAITWNFSRATARSRLVLSDRHSLTAAVERVYRRDASGFDPAFRWFLEHAGSGRTLADLGRVCPVAGDRPSTAYFVDLATALGQLGIVHFEHGKGVS
jgi:methylase of polypeptide subunit release factors